MSSFRLAFFAFTKISKARFKQCLSKPLSKKKPPITSIWSQFPISSPVTGSRQWFGVDKKTLMSRIVDAYKGRFRVGNGNLLKYSKVPGNLVIPEFIKKPARPLPRYCPIPMSALVMYSLFGTVILLPLYHMKKETVPFTKRNHLICLPHKLETRIGEYFFKRDKKKYSKEEKILPRENPHTARVHRIAKRIIEALYREMGSEYIKKFKWEILVVDEPKVNAYCLPGGKIVVYAGLLRYFNNNDAEIATVIGHEVGHAIARHTAESYTQFVWMLLADSVLMHWPLLWYGVQRYCIELPVSRMMEVEADHIGVILMASAGYNPRIAQKVLDDFGKMGDSGRLLDHYRSTHPCGEKRTEFLRDGQVMEEAIARYKKTRGVVLYWMEENVLNLIMTFTSGLKEELLYAIRGRRTLHIEEVEEETTASDESSIELLNILI